MLLSLFLTKSGSQLTCGFKRIDPLVEAEQNQGMVPVFAPIGAGGRTVSHKIRQKLDWRSLFSPILGLLGHRQSLFRPFLWLTLSDSAFLNRYLLNLRSRTNILKLMFSLIREEVHSSQQWVWLKSISQALFLVYRWGRPWPCFQISNSQKVILTF